MARLLIRLIGWRIVDALFATVLCSLDLDPLPLPENIMVG